VTAGGGEIVLGRGKAASANRAAARKAARKGLRKAELEQKRLPVSEGDEAVMFKRARKLAKRYIGRL
jgi:hypothetical protein